MNLAMFQKQFANLRSGLRLLGGIFKARAGMSLTSVRSKGESQDESVACGAGFLHAAMHESIEGPWEVNARSRCLWGGPESITKESSPKRHGPPWCPRCNFARRESAMA